MKKKANPLEPVNVKEDEELEGGVVDRWLKTEESARFVRKLKKEQKP